MAPQIPSKPYEPELGQMCFGQPWKEYGCPEWIEAFLNMIRAELDRVMWNIDQKRYDSPFGNTGNRFKNDVFEVEAYSWNDEVNQAYNFKWKDVEISWYKYLGRGMSINQELTHEKAVQMLDECLKSLREMDEDNFEKKAGIRKT